MAWCGNNHLIFNVNETKEVIVDFRRTSNKLKSISIMGKEVEVVEAYKYLNNRLDATLMLFIRGGTAETYLLRKLRSFSV